MEVLKDWKDLFDAKEVSKKSLTWEEKPVDFETFVESPNFCNDVPLSRTQLKEVRRILGKEPEKIFAGKRRVREYVAVWGKGGGKSFSFVLLEAYVIYLILCYRSFHRYLGISPHDTIDVVNVGINEKQALRLFDRLKERIRKNKWFLDRFSIYNEGKLINDPGKPEINIKTLHIDFPKGLRAIALNSRSSGWEDISIIMFIADEISGFRSEKEKENAFDIYEALTTSTKGLPYIGVLTSFPRGGMDSDPIFLLYKRIPESEGMIIGSIYKTWEVKPKKFYSGAKFDFVINPSTGESIKVPIELKKDFLDDPENAKTRFMCMPGLFSESRFFDYTEEIYDIVHKRRENLIKYQEFIVNLEGNLLKRIQLMNLGRVSRPVFISVDAGEKVSQTAICIGHLEESRVWIDGFILWRPEGKISIDVFNIPEVILELSKVLNIEAVRFDHWNSAMMVGVLERHGIKCERKNAGYNAYKKLKHAIYSRKIVLPNCDETDEAISQLFSLEPKAENKPRTGKGVQDLADSLANLVDYFYDKIEKGEREFILGSSVQSQTFFNPEAMGERMDSRRKQMVRTGRVPSQPPFNIGSPLSGLGQGGSPFGARSSQIAKRLKDLDK